MWCRLIDEKGNYKHNALGYFFDLKCVENIDEIEDSNPHWRYFDSKEDAMKLYNLSKTENNAC